MAIFASNSDYLPCYVIGWQNRQRRLFGFLYTFSLVDLLSASFVDDCVRLGLVTSFPALPSSPTHAILHLWARSKT
jgi:hypothetical protein